MAPPGRRERSLPASRARSSRSVLRREGGDSRPACPAGGAARAVKGRALRRGKVPKPAARPPAGGRPPVLTPRKRGDRHRGPSLACFPEAAARSGVGGGWAGLVAAGPGPFVCHRQLPAFPRRRGSVALRGRVVMAAFPPGGSTAEQLGGQCCGGILLQYWGQAWVPGERTLLSYSSTCLGLFSFS